MAAGGQFCWPPVGSSVAAYGHFFMAANTRFSDWSVSRTFGEKTIEKLGGSEGQTRANVMLPIFGAIAMGVAGIIWSLTGVMR